MDTLMDSLLAVECLLLLLLLLKRTTTTTVVVVAPSQHTESIIIIIIYVVLSTNSELRLGDGYSIRRPRLLLRFSFCGFSPGCQ